MKVKTCRLVLCYLCYVLVFVAFCVYYVLISCYYFHVYYVLLLCCYFNVYYVYYFVTISMFISVMSIMAIETGVKHLCT